MLDIQTRHGFAVSTPDNISRMTPYVLLEQEGWFEDEVALFPRLIPPGCSALDIGANHGVYTLAMAKHIQHQALGGRVLAFEPNTALHPLLTASVEHNDLVERVSLHKEGLSNASGEATFHIPNNSELASLAPVAGAHHVTVPLTTLDALRETLPAGERIGLVKLEAEGAERDILAGGNAFLAEHRPIVMFEIKHGRELNHGLADAFVERGYRLYRVLPELSLLVPVSLEEPLDAYQLNLVACPPQEASRLAQAGVLTESPREALPLPTLPEKAPVAAFDMRVDENGLPDVLQTALAHLQAALHHTGEGLQRRAHAHHALQQLQALAASAQGIDVSLAMARLYLMLGRRQRAVNTLNGLLPHLTDSALAAVRWRMAPHPAFDKQPVNDDPAGWQRCAAHEALVHLSGYSGYCTADRLLPLLKAIHRQPHHSLAMERRLALMLLKQGKNITIRPESALCSDRHRNGAIWQRIARGELPAAMDTARNDTAKAETARINTADEPSGIWLHVGGKEPKSGWQMLNITPGPGVDRVGDIRDLSHIEANACAGIYASHVLEHVHQQEVLPVLKGFARLLAPDGQLMISVPDLDTLCRLYLDQRLNTGQRHHVMRMMFGGQTDSHDFHYVGFDFEFLSSQLKAAGFQRIERVESFGLFDDTSEFAPYGQRISLNMIASQKPEAGSRKSEVGSRKSEEGIVSWLSGQTGRALTEPLGILDIGAMLLDNDRKEYQPLLDAGIASVIGFEPVEAECEKLNRKLQGQGIRFLPYFIGDGRRQVFHLNRASMTSSLYESNPSLMALFDNLWELSETLEETEVNTTRLDDLNDIDGPIDFIKMDIQGAELQALRGGEQLLTQTSVIHTEVEWVAMYKDQPLFAEVEQYLRHQGFVLHRILGFGSRPFKPFRGNRGPQQLWSDVVFVKDFTRLAELTDRQLIGYAAVMHDVYKSHDLVHLILQEYATRVTNGRMGEAYLAWIGKKH